MQKWPPKNLFAGKAHIAYILYVFLFAVVRCCCLSVCQATRTQKTHSTLTPCMVSGEMEHDSEDDFWPIWRCWKILVTTLICAVCCHYTRHNVCDSEISKCWGRWCDMVCFEYFVARRWRRILFRLANVKCERVWKWIDGRWDAWTQLSLPRSAVCHTMDGWMWSLQCIIANECLLTHLNTAKKKWWRLSLSISVHVPAANVQRIHKVVPGGLSSAFNYFNQSHIFFSSLLVEK